jgi:hypothetical protein
MILNHEAYGEAEDIAEPVGCLLDVVITKYGNDGAIGNGTVRQHAPPQAF